MPPSREPPPPCFYRWRECGFVDVYQYVVTVRPLDEADRGLRPTERWQFEPDEYAVDVALRHGKHTHAGHSSVGSKMRMLEQDQGIALSVREYLALLRVGLRDGSPVPDDNGALWAPGGVTIEVAELEGEKHERKQNRELTVKVRNVADGTDLSFTLYARYAGEGYEPMNPTRCTLGVEPLNSADATSRALRAASRRERDAVDALRNGAEALRNAVAFVDAHLGGGTRGVGGNDGNIGFETSRNNSLAGGTPTKTNTGPPPGLKRFRLGLEESASRMAAIVDNAEKRAACTEMGEDENLYAPGNEYGFGVEDRTPKPEVKQEARDPGGGENDLPFAKRRKVQGEGLKLKRQVQAARVKEEAE